MHSPRCRYGRLKCRGTPGPAVVSSRRTRILQREVNLQSTGENCDGRIGAGLGDAGIISASIPARLPSSIESCKRGQHEKGVEAAREALRLNSPSGATRVNLAENLLRLNRFAEAKEVSEAALQRGLDNLLFYDYLYRIAFINGDGSTMQRQLDAMAARPDA